jgi:hypothetical protein
VTRALAACVLVASALTLGCGGVRAADLFLVSRTGAGPHAHLTMLVNEEGGVSCNGGPTLKLEDPQLIKADAIKEDLEKPASSGVSLPPQPGSVLSYSVRSEHGTVRFSDNSVHQPKVLRELALFVLQTAQETCHLPE